MTDTKQQTNQTEAEFFAVVGTGRKGVEDMLVKMGPEMRALAAPNIVSEFDAWATRALVDITGRDELKELISSRTGLLSVYNALARALALGLQIGGQVPHAYIMPKAGKAILVPTAEGVEFAAVYGPGAVLKWVPDLIAIYEKDDLKIDQQAGDFKHEYPDKNPFADRGKLVGFIMEVEYLDGRIRIPHITMADVERIEKHYGNTGNPSYQKSPMQMHEKTAKKQLLKAAFREASGIASRREVEIDLGPEPERPMRDVTERVGDHLDRAADALKPEPEKKEDKHKGAYNKPPETVTRPETPTPGPPPKQEQPKGPEPGDLF